MEMFETILVTGGCGFMGSDFLRFLFQEAGFQGRAINVDKLTYAADPENLAALSPLVERGRLLTEVADIQDTPKMVQLIGDHKVQAVVNFAAESHVDRSISSAGDFARTNICGTLSLLEAARHAWSGRKGVRFHQISTDEVFGSCPSGKAFREEDRYDPSSPYAASKAAADHLVRAFGRTHGLPYTITHACNNYGPCQTPEKLIPLVITRFAAGETVPVYGTGRNVREWMFVRDHSRAVWAVLVNGAAGETYNVGTGLRTSNLEMISLIGREVAGLLGRREEFFKELITFVADRPGHDLRYALDSTKVREKLGWRPTVQLREGLKETVRWYLSNEKWIERARARLADWFAEEGTVWARSAESASE